MYAKLSDITKKKITHFSLRLKIYYFNTLIEKKNNFQFSWEVNIFIYLKRNIELFEALRKK